MMREQDIERQEQRLESYLHSKGLRCTHERRQVLRQVLQYPRQFTAEQVVSDVCESQHISVATVYNTLLLLVECRMLRKLPPVAGRVAEYERQDGKGNSMRFVCTRCGREVAFKNKMIDQIVQTKPFPNFTASNFTLTVYGTCKVCRRKTEH